MKIVVPLAAALLIAGPAAAQSRHATHHPAANPPEAGMSGDRRCPKMDEMSESMEDMKQMHRQMMGQMAQMMQMMQSMHQHQGMGMSQQRPGMSMPPAAPPSDGQAH